MNMVGHQHKAVNIYITLMAVFIQFVQMNNMVSFGIEVCLPVIATLNKVQGDAG
jgi:hypothetical protein